MTYLLFFFNVMNELRVFQINGKTQNQLSRRPVDICMDSKKDIMAILDKF